jgi:hypothetical protein
MIHHAEPGFDFSQLHLASPTLLQGGSFFSKINVTKSDDSLYVYTPRCVTKQSVVVSGTKQYIDLMFTTSNTNFITWINHLEERVQQLLYEKRNTWFVTDSIEMDDIENAFIPTMKLKSSQHILRGYIPQGRQAIKEPMVQVYNEYEIPLTLASIKESSSVISILNVTGVKFSQKCFQLVVNIKQIMVLEKTQFSNCLIKAPVNADVVDPLEITKLKEKEDLILDVEELE